MSLLSLSQDRQRFLQHRYKNQHCTCRRENITKRKKRELTREWYYFWTWHSRRRKLKNAIRFARSTSTICTNVSFCCLFLQGQTSHIAIALPLAKNKKKERRKNEKVLKYSNPPGRVEGRACCGVIKMNNLHSVTLVNGIFECAVCGGGQSCAFTLPVLRVLASLFTRRPVLSTGKDAEVINNGSCVIKYTLALGRFNSGVSHPYCECRHHNKPVDDW